MSLFPKHDLYVKISRNTMWIRDVNSSTVVSGSADFSTDRLLVGKFSAASALLSRLIGEVSANRLLPASPRILMHQTAMCEGGLSEIEHRVLVEMAEAAGARKVVIWAGHGLSDQEVDTKLA